MYKLLLVVLAAGILSCQSDDGTEPWTEHLQNADRASKGEKFERAEIELRTALELLEKAPEARRTHTRVLAAIARLQGRKREFAGAERLFETAIDMQLKDLEAGGVVTSADLIADIGQLAVIKNQQQQYAVAESLLTRILTLRRQGLVSLEPFEPGYYAVFSMMAGSLRGRGLTAEADSLDALSITYQYYAHGFGTRVNGNYPEAKGHYLNALSTGESVLGASHPDIALFYSDLSAVYSMQGRDDQAVEVLQKAVLILEQQDDPTALNVALEDLAGTLERLNRIVEAQSTRDRIAPSNALR